MEDGWIKLHRILREHWIWKKNPFSLGQAWVDMLLIANHEGRKIPYKDKITEIKRGEFIRSERDLAMAWGWSRARVKRFLVLLKNDSMIDIKSDQKANHVIILNYDKFQESWTKNEPKMNQERTSSGPVADLNKNDKNDKNDKNNPPTPQRGIDLPEWLSSQLWIEFKRHRIKLKSAMSSHAEKLMIDKLTRFKNNGDDPVKILEQSIERGWKGIFPLKEDKYGNQGYDKGLPAWLKSDNSREEDHRDDN